MIVDVHWEFGNGAVATLSTADLAYLAPGEYTVALTVRDDDEGSVSCSNTITVVPSPTGDESYGRRSLAGSPAMNPSTKTGARVVCRGNSVQGYYAEAFDQTSGDPVFLHSGEVLLQEIDLTIPGRGLSWSFERTYRSALIYDGPLGHGWDFNYNRRLIEVNGANAQRLQALFSSAVLGDLVRVDGTGRHDLYVLTNGSYAAPGGLVSDVTRGPDGGFLERGDQGEVLRYEAPDSMGFCRLLEMADRNGNTMRFEYNTLGQLVSVVDTLERRIVYAYDDSGCLIEVRDFADRAIAFSYDENRDLVSVTSPAVTGTPTGNDFPNGTTSRYTYSSGFEQGWLNHNLLTITAPNEVEVGGPPKAQFTYATDPGSPHADRVLSQTLGGTNANGVPAGGTILYGYETLAEAAQDPGLSSAERNRLLSAVAAERTRSLESGPPSPGSIQPTLFRTTVTDRNGNVTEYEFDALGHTERLREFTNRDLREAEPEFHEILFEYDDEGKLTRGTGASGGTAEYVYDDSGSSCCGGGNLSSATILPDERGGDQASIRTSSIHEPIYQQIAQTVDARGCATIYTYDYQEGTDYAGLAAKSGMAEQAVRDVLVSAGIAMGLGDVNGDGRTDQIGGNLLRVEYPVVVLPPGANMSAIEPDLRQEMVELYAYNDFGQMVREVDPEGNVTVYEYYAGGVPNGGGLLKQMTRDVESAPGRNSGTDSDPVRIRTAYEYDAVGNIVRTIDGRGIATDYVYNERGQTVQIVRAAEHALFVPDPSEPLVLQDFQYLERVFYDANGNVIHRQVEDRGNTSGVGGDNIESGRSFVDLTYAYDILGNRIEMCEEASDDLDLVTLYRYDANENHVLTVLPAGTATSSDYDERDRLHRVTHGILAPPPNALLGPDDPVNYDVRSGAPSTTTYHHNDSGELIEIVDAADTDGSASNNSVLGGEGDRTRFVYDGFGRLTSEIDGVGSQTVWQYDASGNVVRELHFGSIGGRSSTSDGGSVLTDPVSISGVIQTANLVSDNLLAATEYMYDEIGRVVRVDRVLFVNTIPTARLPDVADGAADIGKGDLTPDDDHPIPGIESVRILGRVSTRTEYDRSSRPLFVVEDDGDTYRTDYDGADRAIRTIDPEGNIREVAYDDNSNIIEVCETDVAQSALPDETFLTTYFYDSLNRLQREVDNLGGTFEYRYDSRGNTIAETDANGPVNGESIDRRAFPCGTLTGNAINDFGNTTLYLYDGLGRLLAKDVVLTHSGRGTGAIGVTAEGMRVSPEGLRCIPRVLSPDPNQSFDGLISLRYEWDANSSLSSSTDDNGNQIRYTYDNLDRLLTETRGISIDPHLAQRDDPDTTTTYVYDRDGNVVRATDENGTVTDNRYDAVNRCISQAILRAPGVVGTTAALFEYDGLSRATLATDNNDPDDASDDSLVTFAYDSLGRVIEETQALGAHPPHVVSSAWRADSQRIALTYPNGRILRYSYDSLDRVDTIADGEDTLPIADYDYVGALRIAQRTYPLNGTCLTYLDDLGRTDTGYDGLRQCLQARSLRDDDSLVVGFAYTYDRMGNVATEAKLHDPTYSEAYGYDSADRLVMLARDALPAAAGSLHSRWILDGAGNWLVVDEESREYSSSNEIIAYYNGTVTDVEFDQNGNETYDGKFAFSWDARNRLRTVTRTSDDSLIATYLYDAANRRIRKTVTNSDPLDGTIDFVHDNRQVIGERNGEGTLVRQYVYGANLDEVLVLDRNLVQDGSATGTGDQRLFYHHNPMNSVFALTDANAEIVEGYHYDAYGRQTAHRPGPDGVVGFAGDDALIEGAASAVENPYMYTGRYNDGETGLYYYRDRYLSSDFGRFLTRDPLPDPLRLQNTYAYCKGNPINRVDPLGRQGTLPSLLGVVERLDEWLGGTPLLPPEFRPQSSPSPNDTGDRFFGVCEWPLPKAVVAKARAMCCPSVTQRSQAMYIRNFRANLGSLPRVFGSKVLGTIGFNQRVCVLCETWKYKLVSWRGKLGWVRVSDLRDHPAETQTGEDVDEYKRRFSNDVTSGAKG